MFFRSLLVLCLLLTCFQPGNANDAAKPLPLNPQAPGVNKAAAKWAVFWRNFTAAAYRKDKITIAALTSPEFYDGGGATVTQWLDAEVFSNEKTFQHFKSILKKPVKSFNGFNKNPYKATGKNKPGDLFFEYKNDWWLFGGMVGD